MKDIITKEKIFEKICISSRLNDLGFLIGSGFSKAIMEESGGLMPSWFELLKHLSEKFDIDNVIFNEGATYPLIASKIIETVSLKEEVRGIDEANLIVKEAIANFVNKKPNKTVTSKYHEFFEEVKPNWIVTTNYDSIIECVVGAEAYPILPNYLFYNTKNILPIYHIHGSILEPSSIVISNEDYAKMMRPSDYRHSRLPILFKESTVLMIGYALGDLNVISALDYRNNVYTNTSILDNCIIQLVYNKNITEEKIYYKNNIYIYEYNDLTTFFNELLEYMKKYKSKIGKITNEVDSKMKEFINEDNDYVNDFIDEESDYRNKTIDFINKLDSSYCYIFTQYIPFLDRVFNKVMSSARIAGQFSYYNDFFKILLDLLKNLDVKSTSTVYLDFLIEKFCEIAPSIGDTMGCSYAAKGTWDNRKKEIPLDFIEAVKHNMASIEYVYNVDNLIEDYYKDE